MDATATSSHELTSALRAFAVQQVKQDEIDFIAELLLVVREENELLHAAALAPLLTESLEASSWLEPTKLVEISTALARILTGENGDDGDSDTDEEKFEKEMREAMKAEYAIAKSCLAVLQEDDDWHPARIHSHIEDPDFRNNEWLSLEVEFLEFGKIQKVQLDEVVLDEDVADDGDEDNANGQAARRCEMCEREGMRLSFHHLTPRDVHAKYIKMGFTREFLNTGIMICRPCHSKIHSSENNKTLAKEYNTLDKVMGHPEIIRWVSYARKQRSSMRPLKKSKWPVGK